MNFTKKFEVDFEAMATQRYTLYGEKKNVAFTVLRAHSYVYPL